jgi:hypothetical protein
MQSIYNYILQRKQISRVTYSFSGILYLLIYASYIIIIIIINITLLPHTSHVSRYRRSCAAVLWLQHMVHLILFPILNIFYFHITTFPNNCAVPNMAAVHNSSMPCSPGMLLRYFLNILEMVPVNPTITGIYYFQISHKL